LSRGVAGVPERVNAQCPDLGLTEGEPAQMPLGSPELEATPSIINCMELKMKMK
jgi:hypothetical protein